VALNALNLTVKAGERVGIIGPNGSGKTTLLKIISGITTPTSGTIKTKGRIVSLIDLEAGFHQDLTGYQNIYLNGLLLGMRKNEISGKLKQIVAFADIGGFIDAPLFTYSSGMKLRLGFSIAINTNPEILIVDEGFFVGDDNFQHKTSKIIQDFSKRKKTILLVSHWLDYIHTTCNRIITFEKGRIIKDVHGSRSSWL